MSEHALMLEIAAFTLEAIASRGLLLLKRDVRPTIIPCVTGEIAA